MNQHGARRLYTVTGVQRALKRDEFVRHNLTGQVFKVHEHGRGSDYLVKTAYKSDGVWVGRAEVTPCKDPHEWTGWHLLGVLIVLVLSGWTSWQTWSDLTAHGLSGWDAFWEGAGPIGAVSLILWLNISGLSRS